MIEYKLINVKTSNLLLALPSDVARDSQLGSFHVKTLASDWADLWVWLTNLGSKTVG